MAASDATKAVIVAGRRAGDGFMRLAIFTRELLEVTVEAHGERASTLLLTRTQIIELQQTLARLAAQLDNGKNAEEDGRAEGAATQPWDGMERREGK